MGEHTERLVEDVKAGHGIVASLSQTARIEEALKPRKWVSEAGPRQTKLVSKAISTLSQEHNSGTTLSGITGVDEHSFSWFSPFGGGSREDVSTVQQAIGTRFDYTITSKNHKAIIEAIELALPALKAARPVKDERRTPEEDAERNLKYQQREADRLAVAHARDLRIGAIVRELQAEYPWAAGTLTEARAAANLRHELAIAFPGVKFSVTSDSSSVNYKWELGPTESAVKEIADKYAYGRFDSSDDLASEYGEAVEKVLGRARFCQGSRNIPAEVQERVGRLLCEAQHVEYKGERGEYTKHLYGPNDDEWFSTHVHRLTVRTSFPLYSEITGIESSNGGYDETTGEDRPSGYYLTFSEPTEAAPLVADGPVAVGASGAVVKENEERGGIEIHFPAKPAQSILDSLHDRRNGYWKYSKRQSNVTGGRGIWYAKASDHTRQFAKSLVA